MLNFGLKFTLFLVAITASYFLGRAQRTEYIPKNNYREISCSPKIIVKEKIVRMEVEGPEREICQKEKPKIESHEYDYSESERFYEESKDAWSEETVYFFEDQFGAASEQSEIYQKLQEEYKASVDQFYKDNPYYGEVNNEDSLLPNSLNRTKRLLELELAFHERLKKEVGVDTYTKLQDRIDKCRIQRNEDSDSGGYWRYCPTF